MRKTEYYCDLCRQKMPDDNLGVEVFVENGHFHGTIKRRACAKCCIKVKEFIKKLEVKEQ